MGLGIVVQKYGGSSVADVERLGRVAERVVRARRDGYDVVVIVSAMGDTTDALTRLARQVDPNPPRRELDMLLTAGERISMALLSMAIQRRGCEAISFTGSQSGILTSDRHSGATILEVRPHRVLDELHRGRVVIVAGFQGMSYRREITTLGRGGSDTTALAMAAALQAERAEIYSDVDGIYTADPRLVERARHLPRLDCDVVEEMAEAGARVLHGPALRFAREAGVPIHCRASFPEVHGTGETVVAADAPPAQGPVAVVLQRDVVAFGTERPAALRRAVRAAERAGLTVRDLRTDERGGEALLVASEVPDWPLVRERLLEEAGPGVDLREGLHRLSLVGRYGQATREQAERLVREAASEPVLRRVRAPLRTSWVLEGEGAARAAARALHARFFEA